MRLIAVDPGLRACGLAYFADGALCHAALVHSPEKTARGGQCWIAMGWAVAEHLQQRGIVWNCGVVEQPQQYEARFMKGDRADITELTGVASAVALILSVKAPEVQTPLPAAWKGQVKKDVHNRRALSRLLPHELQVIDWPKKSGGAVNPALAHNVIDAVALGLWRIGRL